MDKLNGYNEIMARIREEDHLIELCGTRPFEDVMEERMNNGESISVEQLFHLIVNDVHKIYHKDGVKA